MEEKKNVSYEVQTVEPCQEVTVNGRILGAGETYLIEVKIEVSEPEGGDNEL